MSLHALATRAGRRLNRAYHLVCAREDARNLRLRTPLGVWFCDHCRVVVLDHLVWRDHRLVCAG
jgi:hypothetical protein